MNSGCKLCQLNSLCVSIDFFSPTCLLLSFLFNFNFLAPCEFLSQRLDRVD